MDYGFFSYGREPLRPREHAASLFARLDQLRERASCTFYLSNWKTRNWPIVSYPYGIRRAWITGFSLMGENRSDPANMLPACLRGLISVLNEQAARSTCLTGKLVMDLNSSKCYQADSDWLAQFCLTPLGGQLALWRDDLWLPAFGSIFFDDSNALIAFLVRITTNSIDSSIDHTCG
jgi:hypothetical protein